MALDPHIRTGTPESVDLLYQPAGLGSRFLAALLDALFQAILLGALGLAVLLAGLLGARLARGPAALRLATGTGAAVAVLAVAMVLFLYRLIFELAWRGQTPGKRLAGLRVLRADGLPADFAQLLTRNLLRLVDILPPPVYAVGVFAILLTPRGQRLGDLLAGTVVVREAGAALPVLPAAPAAGEPPAAAVRLAQHAARLADADLEPLRAFLQRRDSLPPGARAQVAARLAAVLAARCGWTDPVPAPEPFLERLLTLRRR